MIISLIAAMGRNRAIGNKGKLPWNMPADLKFYRDNIRGKTIIMGRKTFESMGGKPLPDRANIIITRNKEFKVERAIIVHTAEEALSEAKNISPDKEIMVIGGSNIYKEFLPRANRIYMTFIDGTFVADAFFPEFDITQWKEISYEEHERDAENPYDYKFVVLERKS